MVARTGKGTMTRLPVETGETLIVNTVLLIMSFMVTSEAKCFLGMSIENSEVVEFLKERKSF